MPLAMKIHPRWVTWHYESRGQKAAKKPEQPVNRPNTWLSFSDACTRLANSQRSGIGFVLGDGLIGIDVDECFGPHPICREIVRDALKLGSYSECSPSGNGLHVFIRGTIGRSRNVAASHGIPRHEIYDGRDGSARYLTVTGKRIGEATDVREGPEAQAALDAFVAKWFPEESAVFESRESEVGEAELVDDRVLEVMFGAKDGATWRALFDGDKSGYLSQSEADFALIRKLRFYTRANSVQMDRLFRLSGLMREKWDEKHGEATYGESTIRNAIRLGGRRYRGSNSQWRRVRALEGRFGMVHLSVLPMLATLPKRAILAYIALASYAKRENGECHPSADTIAKLTATTREHAQTSISTLKAQGLIAVQPTPGKNSRFRLLAFANVSKLDAGLQESALRPSKPTSTGSPPVSGVDTLPVSNFDTRTDKKHNIDTGWGVVV